MIDTKDVTPDPETKAKSDELAAMLAKELDVAIGTTTTALDSRRATVRSAEAAMGNLVADSLREYFAPLEQEGAIKLPAAIWLVRSAPAS